MSIVLVDDSDKIRAEIKATIEKIKPGIPVLDAKDLYNAYQNILQCEVQFCIIDTLVAKTDTRKFIERIKNKCPGLCIIVLSKNDDENVKDSFYKNGADYFFHKIFELHAFLHFIHERLVYMEPA